MNMTMENFIVALDRLGSVDSMNLYLVNNYAQYE
jgi:hypothetical protein